MKMQTYIFFTVLSCFLSHCRISSAAATFFRKDYEFSCDEGAFYKVNKGPKTFNDARKQCISEGSMLAVPNTAAEAEVFRKLMEEKIGPNAITFLGIHAFAKGLFTTLDGIPIDDIYHSWAPGEPNDAGNVEDCVIMDPRGKLNDENCDKKYAFICEKSQDSVTRNDTCETPDLEKKRHLYTGLPFRDDYELKSDLNAFYKVHRTPMTWHDARTRCDREGAELVVPESSEEVDMLKSVLEQVNAHNPTLYLGIHSLFMKGHFVTLSDVDVEHLNLTWEFGEPNNCQNKENCLTLNGNGRLSDTDCSEVHPFVCKKSTRNMTWNEECNTYDEAYTLAQFQSTCYKLHTQPKNWTSAYDVCKAEGGHLAVINSIEERNFLVKLLEKHPPGSVLGNFNKDFVCVGFHDLFVSREFRTIEGQTLKDAGYDEFAGNQPDDAPPGERCGGIFRNGQLDDLWCDRLFQFICERPNKTY